MYKLRGFYIRFGDHYAFMDIAQNKMPLLRIPNLLSCKHMELRENRLETAYRRGLNMNLGDRLITEPSQMSGLYLNYGERSNIVMPKMSGLYLNDGGR